MCYHSYKLHVTWIFTCLRFKSAVPSLHFSLEDIMTYIWKMEFPQKKIHVYFRTQCPEIDEYEVIMKVSLEPIDLSKLTAI